MWYSRFGSYGELKPAQTCEVIQSKVKFPICTRENCGSSPLVLREGLCLYNV